MLLGLAEIVSWLRLAEGDDIIGGDLIEKDKINWEERGKGGGRDNVGYKMFQSQVMLISILYMQIYLDLLCQNRGLFNATLVTIILFLFRLSSVSGSISSTTDQLHIVFTNCLSCYRRVEHIVFTLLTHKCYNKGVNTNAKATGIYLTLGSTADHHKMPDPPIIIRICNTTLHMNYERIAPECLENIFNIDGI